MTKGSGRNNTMTTSEIETVEQVWPSIAPLLFVPHTEREYDARLSPNKRLQPTPLLGRSRSGGIFEDSFPDPSM